MKNIYLLASVLLVLSSGIFAQDCNAFFPFEQGKKWELTGYNAKGKVQDVQTNEIVSKKTLDNGEEVTVKMTGNPGKKDEISSEYKMTCQENHVAMDMSLFIPAEQMNSFESMEGATMDMESSNIEFPTQLAVGQELGGGSITIKVSMNGMSMMSMNLEIKDRKVISKESITTGAGTFECFKIEQQNEMKMGFVNRSYKSVTYISEKTGIVKTETYDKKGKLEYYQELSKIE